MSSIVYLVMAIVLAPAAAEQSPIRLVEIAEDTNPGGFYMPGTAGADSAGSAVANLGDMNGDGIPDVAVGAPGAEEVDDWGEGRTFVVFGKSDGMSVDLLEVAQGKGGFVINGSESRENSGSYLSGPGDVNGDGIPDVLVANGTEAHFTTSDERSVYVVFGKSDGAPVDLADVANGIGGFYFPVFEQDEWKNRQSVSGAGDLNGDGLNDIVVGVPLKCCNANGEIAGKVYVVYGKSTTEAVDVSAIEAGIGGFVIGGGEGAQRLGNSVSGTGDINGDGLNDIIIGSPYTYSVDVTAYGKAHVVFGKRGQQAAIDISAIEAGLGGFAIHGMQTGAKLGKRVSSAGDVNGDGLDDIVVGETDFSVGDMQYVGNAYVVFGKTTGDLVTTADLAAGLGGFVIPGQAEAGEMGYAVSGAGDVNGDGLDDVIVGAPFVDRDGLNVGNAYLVFGKKDGAPVDLSAIEAGNGGLLFSYSNQDRPYWDTGVGRDVAGVGDMDGNGLSDLLIGDIGNSHGQAYVVFSPYTAPDLNDLYVDFSFTGTENGSQPNPYNTAQEGVERAHPGATIHILPGVSSESLVNAGAIRKRLTLINDKPGAGKVVIGRSAARSESGSTPRTGFVVSD